MILIRWRWFCLLVVLSTVALQSFGMSSSRRSSSRQNSVQHKRNSNGAFNKKLEGRGKRSTEETDRPGTGGKIFSNSKDRLKVYKRSKKTDGTKTSPNYNLFDASSKTKTGAILPNEQIRQKRSKINMKPNLKKSDLGSKFHDRKVLPVPGKQNHMSVEMQKKSQGIDLTVQKDANSLKLPADSGTSKGKFNKLSKGKARKVLQTKDHLSYPSPGVKKSYPPNDQRSERKLKRTAPLHYDSERQNNYVHIKANTPLPENLKLYNPASTKYDNKLGRSSPNNNFQTSVDSISVPESVESSSKKRAPTRTDNEALPVKVNPLQVDDQIARSFKAEDQPPHSEMTVVRYPPFKRQATRQPYLHRLARETRNEEISESSNDVNQESSTRTDEAAGTSALDRTLNPDLHNFQIQLPIDDFMDNDQYLSKSEGDLVPSGTDTPNEIRSRSGAAAFLGAIGRVSCKNSEEKRVDMLMGNRKLLLLQSPNYPDTYPSNLKCIFSFKIPTGRQLKLACPEFDLGPGDHLTMDGLDLPKNLITGTVLPILTTEDFEMEFSSDAEGTSKGFACTLSAVIPDTKKREADAKASLQWQKFHNELN